MNLEYFEQFDLEKSPTGNHRLRNPFDWEHMHKSTSMVLYEEICVIKCYRTGYCADIWSFVMKQEQCNFTKACQILGNVTRGEVSVKNSLRFVSKLQMPEPFIPLHEAEGVIGKSMQEYVESRGFDVVSLGFKGFGYSLHDDWMGYLLIPFMFGRELVYWQGRALSELRERYKNPKGLAHGKSDLLYNQNALSWSKTIYLTEGWACAETLGYEACAYLGSEMSGKQIELLLNSEAETIVLIPDEGYKLEGLKMALKLIKDKQVKVIDLSGIGKDVNKVGKQIVMDEIENTALLTYGQIIREINTQ